MVGQKEALKVRYGGLRGLSSFNNTRFRSFQVVVSKLGSYRGATHIKGIGVIRSQGVCIFAFLKMTKKIMVNVSINR